MKKLILMLFLFTISSYSQKCKYSIDVIDKFTKDTILETKSSRLGKMHHKNTIDVTFGQRNSLKYILLYVHIYPDFNVDENSKFIFLDKNGNTLEFKINKLEFAKSYYDSFLKITFHTYTGAFPLDEKAIEFIKSNGVSDIRFDTNKGDFDFKVESDDFEKVLKNLNCIVNRIR